MATWLIGEHLVERILAHISNVNLESEVPLVFTSLEFGTKPPLDVIYIHRLVLQLLQFAENRIKSALYKIISFTNSLDFVNFIIAVQFTI